MSEAAAISIPNQLLQDDAAAWTLVPRGRCSPGARGALRDAIQAMRLSVAAMDALLRPWRLQIEGIDPTGKPVEREWIFSNVDRAERWADALAELEQSRISPDTVTLKLELEAWLRPEPAEPPVLTWLAGPTTLTWFADPAQPWLVLALDHVVMAGLTADRDIDPDLALLNRTALSRAIAAWTAAVGPLEACSGEETTLSGYQPVE